MPLIKLCNCLFYLSFLYCACNTHAVISKKKQRANVEEIQFFNFLNQSQIYFDTRFSIIQTNNPFAQKNTLPIVPVFGGQILTPFPWAKNIYMGYSMYQNLVNLTSNPVVALQYSEFCFDLRYKLPLQSISSSHFFQFIADYRGRNLYQTTQVNQRSFLMGSMSLFSLGGEYNHELSPATKWGYYAGSRFAPPLTVSGRKSSSVRAIVGADYLMWKKWALGIGYSYDVQNTQLSGLPNGLSESVNSIYLRFSLAKQPFRKSL